MPRMPSCILSLTRCAGCATVRHAFSCNACPTHCEGGCLPADALVAADCLPCRAYCWCFPVQCAVASAVCCHQWPPAAHQSQPSLHARVHYERVHMHALHALLACTYACTAAARVRCPQHA
jgi:hypothetical protein